MTGGIQGVRPNLAKSNPTNPLNPALNTRARKQLFTASSWTHQNVA